MIHRRIATKTNAIFVLIDIEELQPHRSTAILTFGRTIFQESLSRDSINISTKMSKNITNLNIKTSIQYILQKYA